MTGPGRVRFEDVREGDAAPELRVVMDRETYFAYNGLVKNINPLHSDRSYARRLGFEDIVVAGVYTYSFITRVVEDWFDDSGRITGVEISYQRPVLLEALVIHTARVVRKVEHGTEKYLECDVQSQDADGEIYAGARVRVDFT